MRYRLCSCTLAAASLAVVFTPVSAQNACKTPNCVIGGKPTPCADRAAVRTPRVRMTTGTGFVYVPSDPKIEPGDCIEWFAETVTHSSSENTASASDDSCAFAPPAGTKWDSGNVASSGGSNASSFCAYAAAAFPAGTGNAYFCRIHATQTTGSMRGTLRVTTPIQLTLDKSGLDAKLSWSGGGVVGDVTYKVARSADDPTFAPSNVQTVNPDGGVNGTQYTDLGALVDPTTRYYLVRNKQSNEP